MTATLAARNAHERLMRDMKDREEKYRRGMPIEGEIAARMTKPKQAEALHQVFADLKDEGGRSVPIGPKFNQKEAAEMILEAVNAQICLGKLPGWGNARIEAYIAS